MTENDEGTGPVPVRDLMNASRRAPAPEAQGTPGWDGDARTFENDGIEWTVRPAGAGAYGTGDSGAARILAVHFYRAGEEEPERETLLPAARFPHLRDEELVRLLEGATPIEVDRDT